ncbi:hypothetical protein [Mesobacillus foraminis]|uniref:Uncharacterized protein n=1 Tax=Mesobacillus foraminis TaxID=279826 RepID=A0A4R2BKP4_9BACI|nr:hypothetical protein [Mesobacillus foraminis]TCN27235.1 hypothetical protein EV146_102182 [Mesobacillus foraminis]
MKNEDKNTSEGLNQIFEMINAKGDEGELRNIVQQPGAQRNDEAKEKTE